MPDVNWNSVDHLSFAGTDLQELSASLSYLHNGEVRRESRGTTKYRIDLVGTQGISIIASSYDGAFTIHFPASIDTATILIPLTGNAIVAVTDRKYRPSKTLAFLSIGCRIMSFTLPALEGIFASGCLTTS